MIEILKKLALALLPVPVKGETEPEALYEWRRNVALFVMLLGATQMFFVLYAVGSLAWPGVVGNGFALASDVQTLTQWAQETRIAQVERTIKEDRTLQCQAIMEGNLNAMKYSFDKLQNDIDAYVEATTTAKLPGGRAPRVPECSELLPMATSAAVLAPTPSPRAAQVSPH